MWLEVDEDLPEHPKSLRLCAALMNPLGWAYVIKLWRWCCKFAPTGDLSDFSAEELEIGLGWTLDAGKLYAALKTAGFIENTGDGGVVVHDWMDHQGRALKKMDNDRKRMKKMRRDSRATVARRSPREPIGVRERSRLPNLTKPNQTEQDQGGSLEDAPRPASPAPAPAAIQISDLVFRCDGKPDGWSVTQEQLADWERLYPSLDVLGECRKALAWTLAKPANRKTAGGMAAFLVKWFNRCVDRGSARAGPGSRIDDKFAEHKQIFEQGREWAAGK